MNNGWTKGDLDRLTRMAMSWLASENKAGRGLQGLAAREDVATTAVGRLMQKHQRSDVKNPGALAIEFAKRVRREYVRSEAREKGLPPQASARRKKPPKGYYQRKHGGMWITGRLVHGTPEAEVTEDVEVLLTRFRQARLADAATVLEKWFHAISADVRRLGKIKARQLEAVRAAYSALFGVGPDDEAFSPWVMFAHDLADILEAALGQEGAGRSPHAYLREHMTFRNSRPDLWHAPVEDVVGLLHTASLTRGGRGRKGRNFRHVVLDYVNRVRRTEDDLAALTFDEVWPLEQNSRRLQV